MRGSLNKGEDVQQPAPEPALDLRDYLRVLRRRKWSIALIAAVTVGSAVAFSFQQTPIYASTAAVQVKAPTANQFLQNVPVTTLVSMDTEKEIVASHSVAELATKDLPGSPEPQDLLEHLDVSVPTSSAILEITYSDPDPAAAQKGAQAFADGYLKFKTDQAQLVLTNVITVIEKQIQDLQAKLNDAQHRLQRAKPRSPDALQAQIAHQHHHQPDRDHQQPDRHAFRSRC